VDNIKEEFREVINEIIDSMEENDIGDLFDLTKENSIEEESISQLIAIKGEIKKLTKSVHTLKIDSDDIKLKDEADSLIAFYEFLSSSVESLNSMPQISHFGLSKFRESFFSFKKGMEDTQLLYENVMDKFSLIPLAKVGDIFDAHIHEAIEKEENKEKEDGEILEVIEQGYEYKNEIISYPKVKVNKKEI